MKIDHVDEVINEVGNGCTDPLYCTIDDGKRVIFKMYNNPEGNKVLVNEFVCLLIAKRLNLPTPDGGIAIIDENTNISCDIKNINIQNGLGFYSERLDNVTPGLEGQAKVIQKFCVNHDDFIPIILFDHLIYNGDRNNGNVLWNLKNKKIYIIDNSHCFYLGSLWDSIQLERCINDNDFRHTTVMENNKYIYDIFINIYNLNKNNLYNTAERFKTLIDDRFLDKIFMDIPEQWNIRKTDLNMLQKYILYRRDNLKNMCDIILDYRR